MSSSIKRAEQSEKKLHLPRSPSLATGKSKNATSAKGKSVDQLSEKNANTNVKEASQQNKTKSMAKTDASPRQTRGNRLGSSTSRSQSGGQNRQSVGKISKHKVEESDNSSAEEQEETVATPRQTRTRASKSSPAIVGTSLKDSNETQENKLGSSKCSPNQTKQSSESDKKGTARRSRSESLKAQKNQESPSSSKQKTSTQSECKTLSVNVDSEKKQNVKTDKKLVDSSKDSKVVSKKDSSKDLEAREISNRVKKSGTLRRGSRQNAVVDVLGESVTKDTEGDALESSVVELSDSSDEEQSGMEEVICDSSEDSDVICEEDDDSPEEENDQASLLNTVLMQLNAEKAAFNRKMRKKVTYIS